MKNKTKLILSLILIVVSGVYLFKSKDNNNDLIPKQKSTSEIKLEDNDSKVSSVQKTNVDTKNEKAEDNAKKYEPPLKLVKKVLDQIEDIKREKEFYQKIDTEAVHFAIYAIKYIKPEKDKFNKDVYHSKDGNLEVRILSDKKNNIKSMLYKDKNKNIVYHARPYIYDLLNDTDRPKDIFKERSVSLRNGNEVDNDSISKLERSSPVFINGRLEKIIVHDFETESDENFTHIYDISKDSIKLMHLDNSTQSIEYYNYNSSGNLLK